MQLLIIEDQIKSAMSLKRGLKEFGFEVSVALHRATACKAIESGDVHLVLLAINETDTSGFELCRELRTRNSQIPILILTTLGSIDNKLMGFDAGADDYIVKPLDFGELLARIQAHLKRSYVSYDSDPTGKLYQLTIADLTLDLRRKTVSRAGNKMIRVTPREFTLLEYFLRNKGTVLSRAEIAQYIWDVPIQNGTNILNVYINSLRKKIDKDFGTKLIHTRKGLGFLMKDSSSRA